MPDRETATQIEDVAVGWAARAERGLEPGEQQELERWLEGDHRRLGAFVRAQAAWIHAERAASLGTMPDARQEDETGAGVEAPAIGSGGWRPNRRAVLGGGSAVAASIGAAYLIGAERYRSLESGVGEIRHISLAGGTTLTLDTNSRVDVNRSSGDRMLDLVRGKLFVGVARSAAAPLTVRVGDIAFTTLAGAFGIQSLADEPLVAIVTDGRLIATQSRRFLRSPRDVAIGKGHALSLYPGDRLTAGHVHLVEAAEQGQLLAWRDGMISFGGELLGDAVRSFDRYGPTRIIIADSGLAHQRITGLFKASDPHGFATAVATSFGAVVASDGDTILLSPKKSVSA